MWPRLKPEEERASIRPSGLSLLIIIAQYSGKSKREAQSSRERDPSRDEKMESINLLY